AEDGVEDVPLRHYFARVIPRSAATGQPTTIGRPPSVGNVARSAAFIPFRAESRLQRDPSLRSG
ncbi:MAG: hypothetical protein WAU32_14625, partial [Thermoanaerobaculia bacterium]